MEHTVSSINRKRPRRYGGSLFWTLYGLSACILLALGTWQISRHIEKKAAAETIANQAALPQASLSQLLVSGTDGLYRQTSFSGTLLHEHTIYLYTGPMSVNGAPGYDVITPVRVEDADITIAVNRGWIPQTQYKAGGVATPDNRDAIVSFRAVLMPAESPGTFTPDNDDANNIWFWIDTTAIADRVGAEALPVYAMITAGTSEEIKPGSPIPREIRTRKHLPHASYAVTWYSLFLILSFIVFTLHADYKKKTAAGYADGSNKTQ